MGKPLKDERGKTYGSWTVLSRAKDNAGTSAAWLVRCKCGTEAIVAGYSLRAGTSTGCEVCGRVKAAEARVTQGHSRTKAYNTWFGIIRRTENEADAAYANYGGRGIKMHPDWRRSFARFLADMGEPPNSDATIERLDNDGPYAPGNCVWADHWAQNRNRRDNIRVTYNGETLCLADWADKLGIPYTTLHYRYRHGYHDPTLLFSKEKLLCMRKPKGWRKHLTQESEARPTASSPSPASATGSGMRSTRWTARESRRPVRSS